MNKDKNWEIDILEEGLKSDIDLTKINSVIEFLLKELSSENIQESISELSLTLCSDVHIKKLNKEFRGKDKATDVLSFPMNDGFDCAITVSLGDIVISLDTAKVQAKELELAYEERFFQLLIHGLLHLFSYDHEDVPDKERIRMETREDELLLSLKKQVFF
ncbi:UNVERIFIED_CONTAM: hypothetical protein GTU68_063675 [Idotea baltica]|nr:hypothetical protein [Idotea baltica]